MPRFEPFAGLRYDPDATTLAEVIAPPYDVVSPEERDLLAARSPHNAIHVELPIDDPAHGLDRYENAAAIFSGWEHEGAVRRDDVESFYVYKMRFETEDGERHSTLGVIGALRLDVPNGSDVLPHERTTPKPKGDRLELLRKCRTNVSPIWGLSLAPGLAAACQRAADASSQPLAATDDDGILHEMWPVTDEHALEEIAALVASTPVVIADGHHRYETALFYEDEQGGASADGGASFHYVMAYVVELSPDELVVQPIHRLLSGLARPVDLRDAFAPYFEVIPGPHDVSDLTKEMTSSESLGLILEDGTYLLHPLPVVNESAETDLDSSRLDVALTALPPHELTYQHGLQAVADAVTSGRAVAAVVLRPATVDQIAATAHGGQRMPPKTTYFFPKPRTGMVYRPLVS